LLSVDGEPVGGELQGPDALLSLSLARSPVVLRQDIGHGCGLSAAHLVRTAVVCVPGIHQLLSLSAENLSQLDGCRKDFQKGVQVQEGDVLVVLVLPESTPVGGSAGYGD
jgi:hypothetical protein